MGFLVYGLFLMSSIALGQAVDTPIMPDCQDVHAVFLTWPWFGKITAAVMGGMAALHPFAEQLLQLSLFLAGKPGMEKAAKLLWGVAKVAGLFAIGTPKTMKGAICGDVTPPTGQKIETKPVDPGVSTK